MPEKEQRTSVELSLTTESDFRPSFFEVLKNSSFNPPGAERHVQTERIMRNLILKIESVKNHCFHIKITFLSSCLSLTLIGFVVNSTIIIEVKFEEACAAKLLLMGQKFVFQSLVKAHIAMMQTESGKGLKQTPKICHNMSVADKF